jgi:L-lactate utilization protein LutC
MPRTRTDLTDSTTYYAKNRDYILEKARCRREGLPPPPKPEISPEELEKETIRKTLQKELTKVKKLSFMLDYNARYYEQNQEKIKEYYRNKYAEKIKTPRPPNASKLLRKEAKQQEATQRIEELTSRLALLDVLS